MLPPARTIAQRVVDQVEQDLAQLVLVESDDQAGCATSRIASRSAAVPHELASQAEQNSNRSNSSVSGESRRAAAARPRPAVQSLRVSRTMDARR